MFDGRIISGITVFVAVAQAGSYVRAAERIGLSRSGVGKAISRLEDRTGMRLFDRTSRALKLTDEGRAFLDEVTPLLEGLARAAAPPGPDDVRGRLRISSDAAFGTFLLVPALPTLVERHPGLKIDLVIRDRIDNLIADGFDVAMRFGEPEHRGLVKRRVLQSRIVTCASADYVRRHGMPSAPEDVLDGHNCVRLIDDVTGKPHPWTFERADGAVRTITPDCSVTVNDAPSLISAVLSHFGIVRLLDFMAEEHLRTGRLVEILPAWNHRTWPAYLYTSERSHRSAGLQAFIDFALAHPFLRAAEPGSGRPWHRAMPPVPACGDK